MQLSRPEDTIRTNVYDKGIGGEKPMLPLEKSKSEHNICYTDYVNVVPQLKLKTCAFCYIS